MFCSHIRLLYSSTAALLLCSLGLFSASVEAGSYTYTLKLLKIGAVLVRNTRRVRFLLAASYPHQELFAMAVARLASG